MTSFLSFDDLFLSFDDLSYSFDVLNLSFEWVLRKAIVEDIDEDGSGQLEFEEFVMLSARYTISIYFPPIKY